MSNSSVIGALRITLGFDTAEFSKNLSKAKEDLGTFNVGKGVVDGLKAVKSSLEESASSAGIFGSSLAAAGGLGLAAAAALGGLVEGLEKVRDAIGEGAEYAKLATQLGVSTDFVQKFNFAARQSEVDVGAADSALLGLNQSLGQVQSGLARAQTTKAFEAVGFTPEQLRSFHDVGDFFPVLVQRVAAIGNAAEQAAIAKRLGISDLLPMLREGATNFNTLAKEAEDLGIVMDASLVQKAEEAKRKLAEISDVTKAKVNITFAEFADTIVKVKAAFADAERAGLSFLASITNTTPIADRLKDLEQRRATLAASNTAHGLQNNDQTIGGLDRQIGALKLQAGIQELLDPSKQPNSGSAAKALVPDAEAGKQQVADDQAIAQAHKEELAAQIALTANIAQLAALKQREVDIETADQNKKVQDEANNKKISQAVASQVIAANNRVAQEKKDLIQRDALFAAQNQELAHQEALNSYSQQISQTAARLATNATARAAIEDEALVEQQKLDRDKLATQLKQQVATGEITQAYADQLSAEQLLAQAGQSMALERQHAAEIQKEQNDRANAALELQIDLLQSQADASLTASARNQLDLQILQLEQQLERQKLEQVAKGVNVSETEQKIAQAQLDELNAIQAYKTTAVLRQQFDKSLSDSVGALQSFSSAVDSGDVGSAIQAFSKALEAFAGSDGPLASFAQELGAAGQVFSGGSALGSSLAKVFGGNQKVGSTVGGLFGGIIGGIASLFGPGPSNFTASASFNGIEGATLAGDKPNQNTTSAAQQVVNAILQGEQSLASAVGVTLGPVISALQIGQRDPSKITLSNGQVLNAPKGDVTAAVDTALKAVLQGATFADQAEQSLVNSMLAAGKGFDDIVSALNTYQQAQAAVGTLSDNLLQLTNPQAYDLKKVNDAIAAQRQSYQQAAAAGDITADQLSKVNAQLDELQARQIDQVMAKYADAVTQAAQAAEDAANQQVSAAQQALSKARDATAQPLQALVTQFQQLADSLQSYQQSLNVTQTPTASSYTAALAAFNDTAARAAFGDPEALKSLQNAGDALLSASKVQSGSALAYAQDVARVKQAVGAAADTATRQANIAQQQLDALNAQVDLLLGIKSGVEDVGTAIANLQAATSAAASATAAAVAAAAAGAAYAQGAVVPASPAANLDTTALSSTTTTAVDTSNVDTSSVDGSLAASISNSVSDQIAAAMVPVIRNTGLAAELLQQAFDVGMPTVAA